MDTAALSNLLDDQKVKSWHGRKRERRHSLQWQPAARMWNRFSFETAVCVECSLYSGPWPTQSCCSKSWRFLENQRKYYNLFSASSFWRYYSENSVKFQKSKIKVSNYCLGAWLWWITRQSCQNNDVSAVLNVKVDRSKLCSPIIHL